MSFLGSLFSSGKAVEKTVDAVIATGDALIFTEEERSQANQKYLDWVLEYHKASSGSNIARRMIAVMVVGVFLLLVLLVAGFYSFAMPEHGDSILSLIGETLTTPVGIVIGFYFVSGYVRDWSSTKK